MTKLLLNFSTHPGDPEMFQNDWRNAEAFLNQWGFDGFELYPVAGYPFHRIPAHLIGGVHLRFFVILAPMWRQDKKRLLEIFGDWETVDHFYGGKDPECISNLYAGQLNLAQRLGCPYVVFHPAHCELEYVYNWKFPWNTHDILDICAEVVNAATRKSVYTGYILFENLWWPGSFRLDSPEEYDYLLSRIDHPKCGIVLDTGHLLNKNPDLANEGEAVDFLLKSIENLGETARQIRTVHLAKSLSGEYVRKTKKMARPYDGERNFWKRLDRARRHVGRIDCHEPFESTRIARVVEKIDPDHLVFEFTFNSMAQWEQKIALQKRALQNCLWPGRHEPMAHNIG